MKATLYLETTVPSYYTARRVRDLVVRAHQQITRAWWDRRLALFDAYVSPIVLEECRQGDQDAARGRLDLLEKFPILETSIEVEELAKVYYETLGLPRNAIRDAAHLAFASAYEMDYLVTWNCAHIANAEIRRRLFKINETVGRRTPIICTPEELMGLEEE